MLRLLCWCLARKFKWDIFTEFPNTFVHFCWTTDLSIYGIYLWDIKGPLNCKYLSVNETIVNESKPHKGINSEIYKFNPLNLDVNKIRLFRLLFRTFFRIWILHFHLDNINEIEGRYRSNCHLFQITVAVLLYWMTATTLLSSFTHITRWKKFSRLNVAK